MRFQVCTPKGKNLYNAINTQGLQCYSNGLPTHWPTSQTKKPDCIDFFIAKGISSDYIDLQNLDDLSSDHTPLLLTLSNTIHTKTLRPQLTSKNTDWEQFREIINEKIDLRIKLKTISDIDLAIQMLQTILIDAAKQATPPCEPVPILRS